MIDPALKHLMARAAFGLSPNAAPQYASLTPRQAVKRLFGESQSVTPLAVVLDDNVPDAQQFKRLPMREQQRLKALGREAVLGLTRQWLTAMADGPQPLVERMALFWHGHFACLARSPREASNYLEVLRQHGLGYFGDLLRGVSKSAAMLRYLNNIQNRKQHPNENFAREVMELFTLGRGHYTEQDVKEAARAFTGWAATFEGDQFIFRGGWHDRGTKTVLGRTGPWTGDDVIDILLEQPALAPFIARKIYRYFVNPTVDETRVQELAAYFKAHNLHIGKLMEYLFLQPWFYDEAHRGIKIKSPVDLLVQLMQYTELAFADARSLVVVQRALGQQLFHPPNVAGWPGHRDWVDHATLLLRLQLAGFVLGEIPMEVHLKPDLKTKIQQRTAEKLGLSGTLVPLHRALQGVPTADQWPHLIALLLHQRPRLALAELEELASAFGESRPLLERRALTLMTLPEFQVC